MKFKILLLVSCLAALPMQAAMAGDDVEAASDAYAKVGLSVAATPLFVAAGTYVALKESGKGIVKLVDETGKDLTEMTTDIFNDIDRINLDTNAPRAKVGQKEIDPRLFLLPQVAIAG